MAALWKKISLPAYEKNTSNGEMDEPYRMDEPCRWSNDYNSAATQNACMSLQNMEWVLQKIAKIL